jgi:hypothetical protein
MVFGSSLAADGSQPDKWPALGPCAGPTGSAKEHRPGLVAPEVPLNGPLVGYPAGWAFSRAKRRFALGGQHRSPHEQRNSRPTYDSSGGNAAASNLGGARSAVYGSDCGLQRAIV